MNNIKNIRFNITGKCNLKCSYCYISRTNLDISESIIIRALEDYKPINVSLTGGEPFLHPNFKNILILLLNNNVKHINILSNGTIILNHLSELEEVMVLANNNNAEVYISLSYDLKYKFNIHVLNTLTKLGIKIRVFLYPTTEILEHLDKILLQVKEVNGEVRLLFPTPFGSNKNNFIYFDDWKKCVTLFREKVKAVNVNGTFQPSWSSLVDDIYSMTTQDKSVAIDSDGRKYGCCILSSINYSLSKNHLECDWKNGRGCLALQAKYGHDYRLDNQHSPICPVAVSRVI